MQELITIFKTQNKALEIFLLLKDLKPVVRHGYYEEELPDIEKFCKKHSLHIEKSRFKVLLLDKNKDYSNKGLTVSPEDKRKGMFFVYISKDDLLALKALYFEQIHDSYNLGLMLGYPRCCAEFFKIHEKERQRSDNDYILPAADNSKGDEFPFVNNILIRDKDKVLLSHFPCSFGCEESKKLGILYLNALKTYYPEEAKKLEKSLKGNFNLDGRELLFR